MSVTSLAGARIPDNLEVVPFVSNPDDNSAALLIHGLSGITAALSDFELSRDMDMDGVNRIAALTVAANILAKQLVQRMMHARFRPGADAQ